ncbi:hypothetical protein ACFL5G_03575 [Candidatus Margulisiibacteriota bacterium]
MIKAFTEKNTIYSTLPEVYYYVPSRLAKIKKKSELEDIHNVSFLNIEKLFQRGIIKKAHIISANDTQALLYCPIDGDIEVPLDNLIFDKLPDPVQENNSVPEFISFERLPMDIADISDNGDILPRKRTINSDGYTIDDPSLGDHY